MQGNGKFFNIKLNFNKNEIDTAIENAIINGKKNYVCVVDGNVLATSARDPSYREMINQAMVNTCDGASIAILASLIHRKRLGTYTGSELFSKFTARPYRQLFLGNTTEIHDLLKAKFQTISTDIENFYFQTLPFLNINEFNYPHIAKTINTLKPDIIWISLGAPKQEYFIRHLYPHIDKGVLIGIGAAFNLFVDTGKHKRAPSLLLKLKLEWLYRIYKEPGRIGKRALRYACILPSLIASEIRTVCLLKKQS